MTEKSGRIHTSAVSVAILPQADEVRNCSFDVLLHVELPLSGSLNILFFILSCCQVINQCGKRH